MWNVPLFELNYDDREMKAVANVLESGWITMGPRTAEFESAFATLLGSGHCVAVSSCTAALHMAMLALGVGPGDEVLVPALTFVAAVNAVKLVGARPVLVDCESYDVWNCDAERMAERITSRTKAITCVHFAGYPCRVDELLTLCRDRAIPLVEDAAHAPGGTYKDLALGTWGDVGCFSFFTNKNLSVGEGGMVSTGDESLHARFRHLRSHGMTTLTLDRHKGRAVSYDVVRPGLNYRMDEMRAALGLVQLEKLEAANEERRRLTLLYHEQLDGIEAIHVPFRHYDEGRATYHIYPALLAEGINRAEVINSLKERGIQASVHYPSISKFAAHEDLGVSDCPVANDISEREITLPLFPTMGDEKVNLVCEALRETLAKAS